MYSRFVVSLSLISLAFTLSTIYTYNNFSVVAKNFIENQTSVVHKSGVEFYALPPIVFRAVERATYEYEQWLWSNIKESSKVNTDIDYTKIIEYGIRWNGNDLEFYCKENPSNLDYCKEQTWNYVNTTKYFLANFTNVTKSKKYIDYIFNYGNKLLKKLNNTDPDKKYGYVVSAVQIIPLKEVKVNEITKDSTTRVKVLIVVEVAVINKYDHNVSYKVRLPYEVDLEFWIEGDVNNINDPTWVKQRITDVVTKEVIVSVQGKCKTPTNKNFDGCKRYSDPNPPSEDHYSSCCVDCGSCCARDESGNCVEYEDEKEDYETYTCYRGVWKKTTFTLKYSNGFDNWDVKIAKRGYIGLHYVYRIKTTVKYRKDLIEIPFIAEGISDTESWLFTPFARTSGVIENNWYVEDEWVDNHHPCFAYNKDQTDFSDYESPTSYTLTINGYTFYGVPANGGFCNGLAYIWEYQDVPNEKRYKGSLESGQIHCSRFYKMQNYFHYNYQSTYYTSNTCFDTCSPSSKTCYDKNDTFCDPNSDNYLYTVWKKRCLYPVGETINEKLYSISLLQIDVDVPVI